MSVFDRIGGCNLLIEVRFPHAPSVDYLPAVASHRLNKKLACRPSVLTQLRLMAMPCPVGRQRPAGRLVERARLSEQPHWH